MCLLVEFHVTLLVAYHPYLLLLWILLLLGVPSLVLVHVHREIQLSDDEPMTSWGRAMFGALSATVETLDRLAAAR